MLSLVVRQVAPNLQINDYFNLESPTDMETETSDVISVADTLRNVTAGEVFHYQSIFEIPSMQKALVFQRNKESHMHHLLHQLDIQVHRIYNHKEWACLKL